MKRKIIFIAVFAAIFMVFFSHANAAPYNLLQPIQNIQQSSNIVDYVSGLVPFVIMLAAVLAVVQIVIGGMEWAFSESILAKGEGKDRIQMALLGLLIALLSYIILNTINPDLVNLKIPQIDTLNVTGPGANPGANNSAGIGPGTPPGATVDCVVGSGNFTLTKAQCDAQGGSSTGGSLVPPNATVDCVVNGKTFSLTKAQCDSFGGSFPIGGGPTNLGNGSICAENSWCATKFCNSSGKCAPASSAPTVITPPTTNPPPTGCTDNNCGGVQCTGGTSCFCAVGQTSGTCN
ncbi:MAG: hypothetical protein UW28_C0017G0004 [Parcubacteria group bacterium GW2011_GWA2_44_13]|nr:MAG: hypothetical protein UW28_C0017G0004 [Parcubacteria group bacterium GW2011_GWA2_44_13]